MPSGYDQSNDYAGALPRLLLIAVIAIAAWVLVAFLNAH